MVDSAPHTPTANDAPASTPPQRLIDKSSEATLTNNGMQAVDFLKQYQPGYTLPSKKPSERSSDDDLEKASDTTVQQQHRSSQREKQRGDGELVEFDGLDDPGNPKNFSNAKKWSITMAMSLMTNCVTLASSIFSAAIGVTAEEYDVSYVVSTLGVSLFLLVCSIGKFTRRSKSSHI